MYTPTPEELKNSEILNKWVAWLKIAGTIKYDYEIAEGIKMSITTVSHVMTGKAPVSDRFMNRFEAVYLKSHNLRWSDYESIKGDKKDIEYATLKAMMEELLEQNKQILAILLRK